MSLTAKIEKPVSKLICLRPYTNQKYGLWLDTSNGDFYYQVYPEGQTKNTMRLGGNLHSGSFLRGIDRSTGRKVETYVLNNIRIKCTFSAGEDPQYVID